MKEQEILKWSNPYEVRRKAKKLFNGHEFELKLSTRKNKKYMIRSELTGDNWIHFGEMSYTDYTKHKDEIRRDKFRIRNHRWANAHFNQPSWYSFYLLW